MKNFKTFHNWFLADAFIIGIVGIYVAFFKGTSLFIFDNLLDKYFWSDNVIQYEGTVIFAKFMYSIMGALMVVWGVIMYFIVKHSFAKKELWSWKALIVCTLLWFAIDEYFSMRYGVYFNAIFNIPFLLIILIPLLVSRKAFFDSAV